MASKPRQARGKFKDEFSVDIDLTEVNKALELLPAKMQKSAVTSALRYASLPLQASMKRNASRTRTPSSGALAESIGLKASRGKHGGGMIRKVWVGPMRANAKALLQYLSFYGIPLSGKNAKSGIRHGHLVEFGTVHSAENQFIRPAWDSTRSMLGSRFKKKLGQRVEAIIKKLSKEVKKR